MLQVLDALDPSGHSGRGLGSGGPRVAVVLLVREGGPERFGHRSMGQAHVGALGGWNQAVCMHTWWRSAANMRVIVRRKSPHPGAQLRFDDVDGYRLTACATNTRHGQLQHLEQRHRLPARCEDRIQESKDTGLRNLTHARVQPQPKPGLAGGGQLTKEITAWAGLRAHP